MVLATMADSSEREELEDLIEEWNATRLDMFIISKPDAVSRFYLFISFAILNCGKIYWFTYRTTIFQLYFSESGVFGQYAILFSRARFERHQSSDEGSSREQFGYYR